MSIGHPESPSANKRGHQELSPAPKPSGPIRIGVSACVIGREVRYNGGHKLSRFVRDELGEMAEFVPVCPEVEIGLSVPRESMRLTKSASGKPLLIANKSKVDHTAAMEEFSLRRTKELEAENLCGFIVQNGSPSCGKERVKLYPPEGGSPLAPTRGLFTKVLMERFPDLPVEENGRLTDPVLREHFLMRVLAYRRLRDLFESDWTPADLIAFHSREKLLVLAHADYRPLGRLVAHRKEYEQREWGHRYQEHFLRALAQPPSIGKHVNVLQHVAGYFRRGLDLGSRTELNELIGAYQRRLVPLVVPITLMKHHIRSLSIGYLAGQTYLSSASRRLMPQNYLAAR